MFDSREISGSMIGSDPAFIVAKDHVHDPVRAVFDRPMTAYDGPEEVRQHDQRGDENPDSITPFLSRVLSTIAMAFRPGLRWRFRSQSIW
jgi:hypothetical protein